jgi:hypothetical protein
MKPQPVYTNEGRDVLSIKTSRFLTFRIVTQSYSQAGGFYVPVERWVNAISLKNAGTGFVVVMGDPLQPGETKSIGGNAYEIYNEKHLDCVFTNPNAVVNPVNLLVVTQKFYVDVAEASTV